MAGARACVGGRVSARSDGCYVIVVNGNKTNWVTDMSVCLSEPSQPKKERPGLSFPDAKW